MLLGDLVTGVLQKVPVTGLDGEVGALVSPGAVWKEEGAHGETGAEDGDDLNQRGGEDGEEGDRAMHHPITFAQRGKR